MKKILAVLGATGNQGGSVVRHVLQDTELSQLYSVRIIVRDTKKPAVRDFEAQGVEVVEADLNDEKAMQTALKGVNTFFLLTSCEYPSSYLGTAIVIESNVYRAVFTTFSQDKEIEQGKKLADIAVAQGVEFIIFSSLPSADKESGGRYKNVHHFEGKRAQEYISRLSVKSAFIVPGLYMQNFIEDVAVRPHPAGDGTYVISNVMTPETEVPMIDIECDTGNYVAAMLADPEKFAGKQVDAAGSVTSFSEAARHISQVTGKKVVYQQVPDAEYKSKLPEILQDELAEMFLFFQDFGLYGSDQKNRAASDAQKARQKPVSFEQFAKNNATKFKDLLQ